MHANATYIKRLAYSSVNCVTSLCYGSVFDLKQTCNTCDKLLSFQNTNIEIFL